MICFPNAKINLGLNIVSKREDGYHNLETIFYPIGIKDALEIIVKDNQKEDRFIQEGIEIDASAHENLAMKALKLMREYYEFPSVDVFLLKKIPFGAGIGGGSADASFMLRLLNDTFALGASDKELEEMALRLGADCPFFIYNRPMFATGIGEELVDIDLSLKEYYFILIKPDIHVSTREAFSNITPMEPKISLKDIVSRPIKEWKNLMANDFENSVFPKHPEIKQIKEKLYSQGAIYASMTGTGSSVFGIFDTDLENLKPNYSDCTVWVGKGI